MPLKKHEKVLELIKKQRIIPVIKLDRTEDTLPLMGAILKAGCNVAEITFRTDCAEECVRIASSAYPDMLVGAGTVLNLEQAQKAVVAGAQFIVSPGYDADVSKYLKEKGVLYVAGAITPTEIMVLLKDGLQVVKYFPAENYGGIKAIKALSGPFPQVLFIPTGGINECNLRDYLNFKKVIAIGGTWMVHRNLIKAGEFDKITRLLKKALELAPKREN